MLRNFDIAILALLLAANAFSQAPNQQPPRRLTALEKMARYDKRTARQAENAGIYTPGGTGKSTPGGKGIIGDVTASRSVLNRAVKKVVGSLAKSEADLSSYAKGIDSNSINVLRLVPYSACVREKVVASSFTLICRSLEDDGGGGSSYSFRTKQYSPLVYSDIVVENGEFFAYGSYATTFFLDVGNIAFESVEIDHSAVMQAKCIKYLTSIKEYRSLTLTDRMSVSACGTEFRNYVPVEVGHTYIIRSIAYKAGLSNVYSPLELNFGIAGDKRTDSLVVIKVLTREKDESLTLVWKRLTTTDAPKLE